ncbi:head maturation protease, ClpP-related [Roseovarius pacificus]|uniref:head maturation protease, ClpP-related n=1 Tax=Roseovarius pacificus TaxID=337701 RepID=UPI002A18995C|nr:head maturation protease, ClpP-related [Roseovarius pacificus]
MTKRNLPRADVSVRPGVKSDLPTRVFDRWNPDIRAAADEDADNTISILDVIGQDFWGEGVTAKRISAALRRIGQQDVVVNINSPGGDYFEGLAIYNALREHPAKVTVKVLGIAASAASVIAMAGDEVQIARAGFMMIHNTWVMSVGDRHALRDVADWLEPFDQAAVDVYSARTGLDAGDLAKMLDRETWISGSTAVEEGFADRLLDSDDVKDGAKNSAIGENLRAERKFDILAAKAGISRSESRELLAALKGGMPGAAPTDTPGAVVTQGIEDLLTKLKSL